MEKKEKITLQEWMNRNRITPMLLSKMVDCTVQSVLNWVSGSSKPHKLYRKILLKITQNEVEI